MDMFLNFVQYMIGADPGIFVRGSPTYGKNLTTKNKKGGGEGAPVCILHKYGRNLI